MQTSQLIHLHWLWPFCWNFEWRSHMDDNSVTACIWKFLILWYPRFQITEVIQKITAAYNSSPLEGMLSYEIKRYQTEGATDKQIVLNPNEAQKKEIKSVSWCIVLEFWVFSWDWERLNPQILSARVMYYDTIMCTASVPLANLPYPVGVFLTV